MTGELVQWNFSKRVYFNINTHKYIYRYIHTYKERRKWFYLFKNIHQSWLPWTRSKSPRGSTARDACAPFADASSATKVMFHSAFLFLFFFSLIKRYIYFLISSESVNKSVMSRFHDQTQQLEDYFAFEGLREDKWWREWNCLTEMLFFCPSPSAPSLSALQSHPPVGWLR